MWYAMYGDTLASEGAFEDRMSALSRELGVRGRADATVEPESSVGLEPEPWLDDECSEGDDASLVAELREMKLMTLRARAMEAQIADALVDDAMESDAPKSALISLLTKHAMSVSTAAGQLELDLQGLKLLELHQRAISDGVVAEGVDDAMESSAPKSTLIALIVRASTSSASSTKQLLTLLADGEAGVLDHLRNGDADQREQAYTELEAAVARRDTALLCACIPPLYEVLCLDAEVVDTAECQRVCLLLGSMICVDHVACGGCVWKDGLFATPFANAGSALGLVREKSESELCAEDAITLACHMLIFEAPWIKGFAAVAVAAGMSEMQMMVAMGSVAPCYPDAARSIKLTELTMDLLRRRQVPDAVVAGCWMVLAFGKLGAHAEVASKRQFDLGIFELGMTELRTGSPMDWARIQDRDDGTLCFSFDRIAANVFSVSNFVVRRHHREGDRVWRISSGSVCDQVSRGSSQTAVC